VQEFSVVSNNYSAEFGHATGAWSTPLPAAEAMFPRHRFLVFPHQDFNAKDTFATDSPPGNSPSGRRQRGGKIIKDKLFYFFQLRAMRRDFPLIANITQAGNPFSTRPVSLTACAQPPRRRQCDTAITSSIGIFQTVPRTTNQDLGFGKIDWRPTSAIPSAPA